MIGEGKKKDFYFFFCFFFIIFNTILINFYKIIMLENQEIN